MKHNVSHNLFFQLYQVYCNNFQNHLPCCIFIIRMTNCLDWLTAIARLYKSHTLKPKTMIMSLEMANITSRQVYLTSSPSPYICKEANFQEAVQRVFVDKVQGWNKWSGLPILKSKLGRGTGSHRIREYRTEVQRFHLRQKDSKGNIS